MAWHIQCAVLLMIAACVCGGKESENLVFPVYDVIDCFRTKIIGNKPADALVHCVKMGYNLLFENSTYMLNGDYSMYDTAQCAFEKCIRAALSSHGLSSKPADPFQDCLYAVKGCVKDQRDEL